MMRKCLILIPVANRMITPHASCASLDSDMGIAKSITRQMAHSSWIRQMFEVGVRMRMERGAERVFDYTLGNPDVEPPEPVLAALRRIAAESRPHSHGYMP